MPLNLSFGNKHPSAVSGKVKPKRKQNSGDDRELNRERNISGKKGLHSLYKKSDSEPDSDNDTIRFDIGTPSTCSTENKMAMSKANFTEMMIAALSNKRLIDLVNKKTDIMIEKRDKRIDPNEERLENSRNRFKI